MKQLQLATQKEAPGGDLLWTRIETPRWCYVHVCYLNGMWLLTFRRMQVVLLLSGEPVDRHWWGPEAFFIWFYDSHIRHMHFRSFKFFQCTIWIDSVRSFTSSCSVLFYLFLFSASVKPFFSVWTELRPRWEVQRSVAIDRARLQDALETRDA